MAADELGFIGLGRMGSGMVKRLLQANNQGPCMEQVA